MAIDLQTLYSGWTPPADTRQYWTDEDGNVRLDENGNPRLRVSANDGVEYDPQGAYENYLFKNGVVPISSMDTLSRNASALGMDATSFMQMLQGSGQFTTMPDGTQVYVPENAQMGVSAKPMWAPEYEATGLKGFLQSPVAALAGGLLSIGPLQGFSFGDLFGGAPYEGVSGTSSLDSIFGGGSGGGGGGMFDFLDDFVNSIDTSVLDSPLGDQFAQQSADWMNQMNPANTPWPMDNPGGLSGPLGDTAGNYTAQMGANNPFTTAGGSFWGQFGDFMKNPLIPGTNITPGNIGAGLLNYLIQEKQAGRLSDAAFQSAMMSNPLMQPQRFPYQSMAGNLMFDPKGYQMSPYAQGQTDLARQAFEANVSKFGPSGTVFDQYLKNYQNILGQDYFKLLDANLMAGGYTMAPSAGSAFGPLMQASAQAGNNAFEGFGRLLSTTPTPQQTQNNPFQNIFNQASKSWTSSV